MKNKIWLCAVVCILLCLVGCSDDVENVPQTSRPVIDDAQLEQDYADDENFDIWYAIKDLDFPQDYYAAFSVTRYYGSEASTEQIRVIKADGRWWSALDRDGVTQKTYYCADGKSYTLTDCASGKTEKFECDGEFAVEHEMGLISAEEIADTLADFIVNGTAENAYGKIMRVETVMIETSSRNIADIFFYYQGRDAYDEYLIDLETGLVIVADSFEKDNTVYSVVLDNYIGDESVDISSIFDLYIMANN